MTWAAAVPSPWDALDDFDRQMKTIELIPDDHVEWRGRGAFFLEAANVHSGVVGAIVGRAMDQARIAVIGENHGTVVGEHSVEFAIAETVRMRLFRLQGH